MEIANDADLRVRAPKTAFHQDFRLSSDSAVKGRVTAAVDPRLPAPGGSVERHYKGRDIVVTVREDGFEYDGKLYKSLSAIAHEVTGCKWNGFLFFGCAGKNGGTNEKR
jgi:hypothetical protein